MVVGTVFTVGAALWFFGVAAVIEPIDNHNGVMILKEATAHHQVDTYHLVIVYNISNLRDIYVEISRDYITFNLIQTNTSYYRHSLVLRKQIEYLIDKVESKLVYLGSKMISAGRTYLPRVKRGLINGLGSIVKAITGNMDQEDAIRLENEIQQIKRLALNKQHQTLGLMTDFMNEYKQGLENISNNQRKLSKAIQGLNKQNGALDNQLHINSICSQIEIALQQIFDRLLTLENALTFSHLGRLHPSVVDPSYLVSELIKIERDINKNNLRLPYSPTVENIHLLEKAIIVKAYSTNESLNFVLEIPLVTNYPYSLLHLYSIPNQQNIILIPKYPYLILGSNKFAYSHEPCSMITEENSICRHLEWKSLKNSQDCIAQLLQHENPTNCTYAAADFEDNMIKQIKDNSWIIIIKKEEVIKTTGGNDVQYQRNHGVVLITINNKCIVEIAGRSLQTHLKFVKIKESIPLPQTSTSMEINPPITLHLEDIPLDNLNELLRKTQIIQQNEETPTINIAPSWPTLCLYIIATLVVVAVILRWYLRRRRGLPATIENHQQLQLQEPLQQQQPSSSSCFKLKGGGVISA
ncbi:uncharacterized protein LOC128199454 [Bicyclus anynana]|uniref:Uncharacterized protein LOC128199454 n=1 Tax=Bicyclus anynana TaxID=110368 RepID=A0ABM3M0X5_BICAN|nr:uncharacterized protein LOC128199454 [Bicyclus anynana]